MAQRILQTSFKKIIFIPLALNIIQNCRSSNSLITKAFSLYSSGIKGTMEQEKGIHVIDVRSDTVTKPTPEMRQVMANAEVGDDVFGEDPSINSLQEKSAKLLGKEAGLFVPSGSMGNIISIMAHCPHRGDEILVGDKSHICIWEQGSCSQIAGVHSRQIYTHPNGELDLEDMKSKIYDGQDDHFTHTKLICLEQTHNYSGGSVLSLPYLEKVKEIATVNNLSLHMDGARLFNAVAALGVPAAEVTKHMDSVTFCLSKALGAPVGSVIVGSKEFIARCHRHRKALGGGMRQAGIIAAAGIYALDNIAPKLVEDHTNTNRLVQGLMKLKGIDVDPKEIQSNMVYLNVTHDSLTANDIVHGMGTCSDNEPRKVIVKLLAISARRIRIVFHHQVQSNDVELIINKLRYILQS
ncbi:probable low-specificity L-threonine aldolase 1 [Actinia tenebrosa]|uniref:Probable low-specificity L-threonine aldolase 1 n=1 Tax=Actinia tenebrosa TaxID=6105 RepID=A0A6P8ICB2_ACTTE|nr:probable low-specificity L-threonine aldolase 1 [Actinia tenebrosa]